MIKEVASKLVPLVDSKKNSDLLELYMNHRVEELQNCWNSMTTYTT